MIVKIKTFSGETLFIPEEDYLNEVMYSDLEEREFGIKKGTLNTIMSEMPGLVSKETGHTIPRHNLRQVRHSVQVGYNSSRKGLMTPQQAAAKPGDFGGMFGMKKRTASRAKNIANTQIARADLKARAAQRRLGKNAGKEVLPLSNTSNYFQY